jgi:uncharacterized membrane protein YukC
MTQSRADRRQYAQQIEAATFRELKPSFPPCVDEFRNSLVWHDMTTYQLAWITDPTTINTRFEDYMMNQPSEIRSLFEENLRNDEKMDEYREPFRKDYFKQLNALRKQIDRKRAVVRKLKFRIDIRWMRRYCLFVC